MRRINSRVLVHAAHEPLSARLLGESQLLEYVLQPVNYRPIKLIVVLRSPSASCCYLRLCLIAFRGSLPIGVLHLSKCVRLHIRRGWQQSGGQVGRIQGIPVGGIGSTYVVGVR